MTMFRDRKLGCRTDKAPSDVTAAAGCLRVVVFWSSLNCMQIPAASTCWGLVPLDLEPPTSSLLFAGVWLVWPKIQPNLPTRTHQSTPAGLLIVCVPAVRGDCEPVISSPCCWLCTPVNLPFSVSCLLEWLLSVRNLVNYRVWAALFRVEHCLFGYPTFL